ncbi:MAG: hypothetical protein ACW99A_10555 [Candidatus Kariarchaeaceae archaeon]|jgi:hypothetical protein
MNILVFSKMQFGINRSLIITFVLLLFFTGKIIAQDTQYWTQTYGTSSTLLGGIVIGSVSDLGATYYNPGNLSLTDDPNFLFTARVFEFTSFTMNPLNPKVSDVSKTNFQPSPSFAVINITADWLGKNRIAISFLTRQKMDLELKSRFDDKLSENSLSNEFFLSEDLNDLWVGITWSYPFKKKFGIGITQYICSRSFNSRHETNIKTSDSLDRVSAVSAITEYEYLNFRILWKAGIGFTFEQIRFGLTVTTPSINLFGSGSTDINLSSAGLDYDSTNNQDDFLISNFQEELSSTYNSPFSIGLGAYYKFGRFQIHVATEYYTSINKYNILTAVPFESQTGNITVTNNLASAADAVLNYGLGLEYFINPKFTLYGAFNTDFSAFAKEEETNSTLSRWDIYHITAGAAFTINDIEITSGITTSFANDNLDFPIIKPTTSDDSEIVFPKQPAEISSFRIKLILGITF